MGPWGSTPTTPEPTTPASAALLSYTSVGTDAAALREYPDGKHLALWVGYPSVLRQAANVALFDGSRTAFPRVHAGSDVNGRAIVTYPRCGDGAQAGDSCALYAYSIPDAQETRLRGIPRGVYEGTMRRGALLYAVRGSSSARGLWYRPAKGSARRLAWNAGEDLALNGSRAAHVISDGAKVRGEEPCENTTVVLRSVRTGKGRVVGRRCAFGATERLRSLSFWHATLGWAGATRTVYRYDPLRGRTTQATLPFSRIFDFSLTADSGWATTIGAGTPVVGDLEPASTSIEGATDLRWTPARNAVRNYPWDSRAALR